MIEHSDRPLNNMWPMVLLTISAADTMLASPASEFA